MIRTINVLMDFSKAFGNVKYSLLGRKLKSLNMGPFTVNWYLNFFKDRSQRLVVRGSTYQWRGVNKGPTQGSVSGPHLFNLFINEQDIAKNELNHLVKYADDIAILVKECK